MKDARARLTLHVAGTKVSLRQLSFFVNRFSTIYQKMNETTRADDRFHFKFYLVRIVSYELE